MKTGAILLIVVAVLLAVLLFGSSAFNTTFLYFIIALGLLGALALAATLWERR